jgi:hypothetical protein
VVIAAVLLGPGFAGELVKKIIGLWKIGPKRLSLRPF